MKHIIGTYNMSFMSDKDTPLDRVKWASEWTFLSQQKEGDGRRSYWINAMNLLREFIINKKPSMVGLQEMNITNTGTNTGTDAINTMLAEINQDTTVNYKQISKEIVIDNNIKPAVSIIYNETLLGEAKNTQIIDNPIQGGRPILMVITKKIENDKENIYLLITIHGAQNPNLRIKIKDFNQYMKVNNKSTLETQIPLFLESNNMQINDIKNIFIAGDFNDRYDAIKEININGKTVSYNGTAPKSCCYNWDSSCEVKDIEIINDEDKDPNTIDSSTCKVPNSEKSSDTKVPLSPLNRGEIRNYKYKGDKVFGLYPKENINMYKPINKMSYYFNPSKASDHELVYATFSDSPVSGGKRKIPNYKKYMKSNKLYKHRKNIKNSRKNS
jgi:hypothetical protein